MTNIISKDTFLTAKIEQQKSLWQQGQLTTAQLVDYVLGYGTDDDVEWLCANFDPWDTLAKY
jgi:hypothetical protein